MKRTALSLLLVLALLLTLLPQTALTASAAAYSGNCGSNLTWTFVPSSGTLTIQGSGAMDNYASATKVPWYAHRASIRTVVLPDAMTSVGSWAFYGCTALKTVTLPADLTALETHAFHSCTALNRVDFAGGLTRLGDYAFALCTGLTAVALPAGLQSIGSFAFYSCTALTDVQLPAGLQTIGASAFGGRTALTALTLPEGLTAIGSYAFGGCTELCSVSFPQTLRELGGNSFRACYRLTSVTLPEQLAVIGDCAFYDCIALERISILSMTCQLGKTLSNPAKTTLCAYRGSTTEQYASRYGYSFLALEPPAPDPVPDTGTPQEGLSDEILHLIFADMAYARIPASCKGDTVSEWLNKKTYLEIPSGKAGYDESELSQTLFDSGPLNRLLVYGMVGDWTIADVIDGEAGYAAVVYQKDDRTVIAYRGSEDGPASIGKGEDWWVDAEFALFNVLDGRQFGAALDTYRAYEGSGTVTVTGHSLGGALVTYVSTLTGVQGYSFDGAAGHVIDLTYLFEPMNIDFHSKDQMSFINYTDPPGVQTFGADLIQHTNEALLPGICYETNPHAVQLYSALFWTHQQYSNTRPSADGTRLEFMPVAEQHTPMDNWYASVDYSFLGIATGGIGGALSGLLLGGLPGVLIGGGSGFTWGYAVGRLIKVGNVHLGTAENDEISVLKRIDNILDITAAVTENVMYGGDGTDVLIGAASGDTLIPGGLDADLLSGGLGSDVYLLDLQKPGTVTISDASGADVIRLRHAADITEASISPLGLNAASNAYGFSFGDGRTVYLHKTLFRHGFQVLAEDGSLLCNIDTKGGLSVRGPVQTQTEPTCTEITLEGACQVAVYAPDGTLADTYSTQTPGLYATEYGTVYIAEKNGTPILSATIYDTYTVEASGTASVDLVMVGTGSDHYINQVSHAEQVDLNRADAQIEPQKRTVSQNDRAVLAQKTAYTEYVSINTHELRLPAQATDKLTAKGVYADKTATDKLYWISTNPDVAVCEAGEHGVCTVKAVAPGETTIYAVAEDSGFYTTCHLTVEPEEIFPFMDVPSGQYYYDAVRWAYFHNPQIAAGTGLTQFSPNQSCTRAQIMTFLWNAFGKPVVEDASLPFEDVSTEAYYYLPVLWANQNGVTGGTSQTQFSPAALCTRAQALCFLWAACGRPEPTSTEHPFADLKPTDYYYKAVLWAYERGITGGTDPTHFSPRKPCTRAQVLTFLYKAMNP